MRRNALQQGVDQVLVDVCRGVPPTLPDAPGVVEELATAARYHRIAPLTHVALRESRPEVAAALKEDRSRALLNHLRTSALLGGVSGVLTGVEWLAFKGPMLSEFAHPVPGLRFYKDLDLLVAPGRFREACNRLIDAGWRVIVSDESLLADEFPGEVALMNQAGVVMDLHWAVVVMRSVRRRFDVTAEALLERRIPVTIGPAGLWALSPADALVHVCQHAALVGATKLGHVLDADQLARQVTDWDDVVARAEAWGAGVQVAAVLGRAHRLLGTPLAPGLPHLEAQLGVGAGVRRVLAAVDRRWPVQTLRRDESWVRLVTKAVRPGLLATGGVIVARGAKGVRNRLRAPEEVGPRVPASPEVIKTYLTRVEAMQQA